MDHIECVAVEVPLGASAHLLQPLIYYGYDYFACM